MMIEKPVAEIVARARDDESCLVELLAYYRPYLRLMAEQSIGPMLRRREDPSDVLQQTELEVAQDIQHFRGTSEHEFSAWIQQVLKRNILSVVRTHHAAKRDLRRERFIDDGEGSASITWKQPAARDPSPSRQLVLGESALKLAAALDTLPVAQRDAVRMRHLEGMKIDDIATTMGISVGAAAGFIRRGVEELRNRLRDDASLL